MELVRKLTHIILVRFVVPLILMDGFELLFHEDTLFNELLVIGVVGKVQLFNAT
jgi:hypothetical protein